MIRHCERIEAICFVMLRNEASHQQISKPVPPKAGSQNRKPCSLPTVAAAIQKNKIPANPASQLQNERSDQPVKS